MYPTSLLCSILRRISEQSTLSSVQRNESKKRVRCISLLARSLPWSIESIIRCWTESVLFFFSDGFFVVPGMIGSSDSETRRCGLLGFSTSPQKILVIFVSWSWSSSARCFFRCRIEDNYWLSELSPCWSKRLTCLSSSLISVTIGPTCLKIFTWFSSILTRSVTYWPLRLINWKARLEGRSKVRNRLLYQS